MGRQTQTIARRLLPPVAVLLSLLLPVTVWAGGPVVSSSAATAPPPLPSLVLARYVEAAQQNSRRLDCRKVAVEIEASLPKLAQRGRLQAIRQLIAPGRHEYQALRIEGDRTVRQQVIARYLSAEAQADALPSDSVAVSPANYKFRYAGAIGLAKARIYVFEITPRRKRAGLIQGELWIDAASGVAVRKAGRMVKTPSVFVRRIDVAQDIDIHDGEPYLRITNLEIDTRLVGRAELMIQERLCDPTGDQEVAPLTPHEESPTTVATQGLSNDEPACSTVR